MLATTCATVARTATAQTEARPTLVKRPPFTKSRGSAMGKQAR